MRYRPKLLYTNPTFQNPTGAVIPLSVKRDLLELAARYHLPIVEDEPYRDLYYTSPPPPSLRDLDDQGLVISLSTYSKTLAPGLRLGWLAAPEPPAREQRPQRAFPARRAPAVFPQPGVSPELAASLRAMRALPAALS